LGRARERAPAARNEPSLLRSMAVLGGIAEHRKDTADWRITPLGIAAGEKASPTENRARTRTAADFAINVLSFLPTLW
jgi:hypothetical protein